MRSIQRGVATSIILVMFLLLGIAAASGYFIFYQNKEKNRAINTFEECAKYYPVMESYPQQCNTPDGRNFLESINIGELKSDNIKMWEKDIKEILKIWETSQASEKEKNKSWISYKGENFRISYLSTWQIEGTENSIKFTPPYPAFREFLYPYEVSLIIETQDFEVLQSSVQEYINDYKHRREFRREEIAISGKPAVKLYNVGLDGIRVHTILIDRNKMYTFMLIYADVIAKDLHEARQKYPEAEEIYNEMLNSFKIVE